jgi:hypothetical protein
LTLADCRNIFIRHCHPLSNDPVFLKLEGRQTESITLAFSHLMNVQKAFELAGEVNVKSLSVMSNIMPNSPASNDN